jgi:hypothetical protein
MLLYSKGRTEVPTTGGEGQVTLNRIGILEKVDKGQSNEATTNIGQRGERTGGWTNIIKKEHEEIIL